MNTLFLTSFAAESMNIIIPRLPKKDGLRALFIPTAGDVYENKDFVYVDRDALVDAGIEVTELDIKDKSLETLKTHLENTDIVLIAGGNTFYLLDHMRKSGFDILIKEYIEKGLIYIGSSAGSIVCCPTISGALQFDDPKDAPALSDYKGLGLVDIVIIPHSQKERYSERIIQTTEKLQKDDYHVVTLSDDELVYVEGQNMQILSTKNTPHAV